jgi:hypothetical protein
MSKLERTGWRDQELSERHRLYGPSCCLMDLDCLWIEYDALQERAIIEYKAHHVSSESASTSASAIVVQSVAAKCSIPAWIAYYNLRCDRWQYRIVPLNQMAVALFGGKHYLTEAAYVAKLYEVRNRAVPESVLHALASHPLPESD